MGTPTAMLIFIFLALALLVVQSLLPAYFLTREVGLEAHMGPRDALPPPGPARGRAERAFNNLRETLPVFLTLAVLSIVLGENGTLSLIGAVLYLLGRIAHAVCYQLALNPWRSYAYFLAMIGNGLVALPLLPHIWG